MRSAESRTGDEAELLSIGELAAATGISVDTLRVWERRYGRPRPQRLPSGHRRYPRSLVAWLRRVSEALARGHRPSQVLRLDDEALARLTAEDPIDDATQRLLRDVLELTRAYRAPELREVLGKAWDEHGPIDYLEDVVTPLLHGIGRAWAAGEIGVRHEHFVTAVVADELRAMRQALTGSPRGDAVLLATLPGERHCLGLEMVAIVCALCERPWCLLGADLAVDEIADAAWESGCRAVAVSISLATGGVESDRMLKDLRGRLPEGVDLLAGGAGARRGRRGPMGVRFLPDLGTLRDALTANV